jgi:hypothetical protein
MARVLACVIITITIISLSVLTSHACFTLFRLLLGSPSSTECCIIGDAERVVIQPCADGMLK